MFWSWGKFFLLKARLKKLLTIPKETIIIEHMFHLEGEMSGRGEKDENFRASRYLTKLDGKDYLEVKWRLLWLRTEHPDAVIATELEKYEGGMALFKAKITLPGGWGGYLVG